MRKWGNRRHIGELAGMEWSVHPSTRNAKLLIVWRGDRYYSEGHKTLRAAKQFIARVWLGEKLVFIRDRIIELGPPDGLEGTAFFDSDLIWGLDDATVYAFVDWCQDHGMTKYVTPVIREGNRAGLLWPGAWADVAKQLRTACK